MKIISLSCIISQSAVLLLIKIWQKLWFLFMRDITVSVKHLLETESEENTPLLGIVSVSVVPKVPVYMYLETLIMNPWLCGTFCLMP